MFAKWNSSEGRFYFSLDDNGGVEIPDGLHAELFAAQSSGRKIVADENGYPVAVDPPPPTDEQIVARLTESVQAHLDATAKKYGYDDIKSAVTYADEPAVVKFQTEGRALRAWRSLVWNATYLFMADVKSGLRPVPTSEQLIAALPVFAML